MDAQTPVERAAILAGGRAARLGGAKASAELGGRPLISYPLQAAREAGLEPFVVAKASSPLPALDCEIVREPDHPVHPLLGIVTALERGGEPVVILGCDMPFVPSALLRLLSGRRPSAVCRVAGRLEPLLAIYSPSDADALRAALSEEAALRGAVTRLDPEQIGDEELSAFGDPRRIVASINTPADLERAERALPRRS